MTPGRPTTLQGMDPYSRLFGQHKLDFMGFLKKRERDSKSVGGKIRVDLGKIGGWGENVIKIW